MPHRLEKSVGLFAVASLVVISGTFVYRWPRMVPANPYATPRKLDPIERQIQLGVRQVYPYSVVPGGVYNPIEVIAAVRRDPVVERHYEGIALSQLTPVVLKQSRLAYVSYRQGDRVFWTRKPVVIRVGEAVLTDGREKIRARCGNRISDLARMPVGEAEPTPAIDTTTPTDEVAIVARSDELREEIGDAGEEEGQRLVSFTRLPQEDGSDWWPILPGFGGAVIGGPGGGGGGGGTGGGGDVGGTANPGSPANPAERPTETPANPPGGSTPGAPSTPPVEPYVPGRGSDLPGFPPSIPPYVPQVPGPTPTNDGPKPLLELPGTPGGGGSGDSTIPLVPASPATPGNPATPGTPETPGGPGTPDNPFHPGNPDQSVTPDQPSNPGKPGTPAIPDQPDDSFRPVPEPRLAGALAAVLAGLGAWHYWKRRSRYAGSK